MSFVDFVSHAVRTGAVCAQHSAVWLLDGPKRVLNDVKATTDALKLAQKVNEIAVVVFDNQAFQSVARAFSSVTDFFGARNIIGAVYDLMSGKAAWDNPIDAKTPNYWSVLSKVAFTVGDLGTTVKWLSNVNLLGPWVRNCTAQIGTWGREFNLLKGIGDVSCVTGTALDLCDLRRQIRDEFAAGGYFRGGRFQLLTATKHALSLVSDITKIAGPILSNIPGVNIMYSTVAATIGTASSLGKFFAEQYWRNPSPQPV